MLYSRTCVGLRAQSATDETPADTGLNTEKE
jgi:hypothetical protein